MLQVKPHEMRVEASVDKVIGNEGCHAGDYHAGGSRAVSPKQAEETPSRVADDLESQGTPSCEKPRDPKFTISLARGYYNLYTAPV